MEYLNNSHLYNDFDNSYSLIDLKNKNFLKNNLLEVEKKHIYSNTNEENYLNITNNSDINNNTIEYFMDLLKKFKEPLYHKVNDDKNVNKIESKSINNLYLTDLHQDV